LSEPTREEQAYFKKLQEEQLAKLREKQSEEEAKRLREQHWMRCAKCGHEMITVNFRGVAIERCPSCGGVYLDAGELEKLAGEDQGGVLRGLGALFGLQQDGG
jgi:acetyl-CoA carboxylase beta subunit